MYHICPSPKKLMCCARQAFTVRELAAAVPLPALRGVMATLLLRMLDPLTLAMPEGITLLKGLNVLMLRVLENSDRCALPLANTFLRLPCMPSHAP
jgi:hypothetical protein